MKRPFLVASDLRPCVPMDETQRKNGNSTDWDKLDVILAGTSGDIGQLVKVAQMLVDIAN
ncbi:hypothetical protein [Vibrio crassostreae]|uniref:hypothetical protein n=1 Tax=Vibrio crassostreae TaxID=246167 RepID=UPI000F512571|nr:hypothetical protein [Vibrio crassostreae]